MKFSCTQENLKRGLMITGSIASKNLNLPVLNNVLIRIDGTNIQFLSTNLEIAIRCTMRGKVEEDGDITLPSKLFLDYVNLLGDEKVDITVKDDEAVVVGKRNRTKIKGIPSTEFPLIPTVERETVFHVDTSALRKALGQVNFAVSGVESRPELTGVLFNINPEGKSGHLVLAATDSYRLSERTIPIKNDKDHASTAKSLQVIVPGRTLSELLRVLSLTKDTDTDGETVEVAMGESQVSFRFGDIEMISRVIDGKYPDYRPIIPDKFSSVVVVSKPEFSQAVKSASLFSRAGLQDVRLEIDPETGMQVSSGDTQMGRNESMVDGAVEGAKNAITLNYRYLIDGLNAIEDHKVKVKVIDATNPCVVTPESGTDDDRFLYIVMPIKQ